MRTFQEIAETYQGRGIRYDDMIVDNTAMQIVSNPTQFDILLTPNLYGTICANIGSGIIGGAGLVPGLNLGRDICLFEPGTRHAAIDLKDKNCANPTSILLSASWMLKHLSLKEDAEKLHQAILSACKDPAALTKDLKGSSTTTGFTDIIMSKL